MSSEAKATAPADRAGDVAELKTTVKSVDMAEDMAAAAQEVAKKAMKENNVEKDIAQMIKKEFDAKYGNTWHCIVGRNFGSFVTHETKHFIYFYVGNLAVLLYKTA
ncbi:dynein light chain type 1-domain-containing protein [Pyronema omphalodes]|nr:dynein light chain type 1-domain-containing protein [Pyronema omphalodes]